MRITFDPAKNEKNIAERGLSFALAEELEWDTAFAIEDTRRSTARRDCVCWRSSTDAFMRWL